MYLGREPTSYPVEGEHTDANEYICRGYCAGPQGSMSILCYTCRGLGDPQVVDKLHNLVRRRSPTLVFLAETKKLGIEMT